MGRGRCFEEKTEKESFNLPFRIHGSSRSSTAVVTRFITAVPDEKAAVVATGYAVTVVKAMLKIRITGAATGGSSRTLVKTQNNQARYQHCEHKQSAPCFFRAGCKHNSSLSLVSEQKRHPT